MKTTIRYTEPILKQAIFGYIKRVYMKNLLWASLIAILMVVLAFQSNAIWLRSLIIVAVGLIPGVLVLGYGLRIKQSLKIIDRLDDGRIDIEIDDEGLTTTSAVGQSKLAWGIFTDIVDTPASMLLMYSNQQFITLPKAQIAPDFMAEISRYLEKR